MFTVGKQLLKHFLLESRTTLLRVLKGQFWNVTCSCWYLYEINFWICNASFHYSVRYPGGLLITLTYRSAHPIFLGLKSTDIPNFCV